MQEKITTQQCVDITEGYSVIFKSYEEGSIKLSPQEKLQFNSLSAKSKLSRLSYLKRRACVEKSLIDIISQSKYLILFKDNTGFHIRLSEDIPEDWIEIEETLISEIRETYNSYLSEDVNYGMSGDINRILISKGCNS